MSLPDVCAKALDEHCLAYVK